MNFNIDEEPAKITILELIAIIVFSVSMFVTLYFPVSAMIMFFAFAVMLVFDKIYFKIKKKKSVIWKKVRT